MRIDGTIELHEFIPDSIKQDFIQELQKELKAKPDKNVITFPEELKLKMTELYEKVTYLTRKYNIAIKKADLTVIDKNKKDRMVIDFEDITTLEEKANIIAKTARIYLSIYEFKYVKEMIVTAIKCCVANKNDITIETLGKLIMLLKEAINLPKIPKR